MLPFISFDKLENVCPILDLSLLYADRLHCIICCCRKLWTVVSTILHEGRTVYYDMPKAVATHCVNAAHKFSQCAVAVLPVEKSRQFQKTHLGQR